MKIFFPLFCIMFLYGCKPIYRLMLGVKKAKPESVTSTMGWLHQNISDTISQSAVLALKPQSFPKFFDENPMVFDEIGNLMVYKGCTSNVCLADLALFLQHYPERLSVADKKKEGFVAYNFNKLDSGFLQAIVALDGSTIIMPKDAFRNTLVLPLAQFLGNKKQARDLQHFASAAYKNKAHRWKILWLSFDKQQWWGNTWNSKINMSIN